MLSFDLLLFITMLCVIMFLLGLHSKVEMNIKSRCNAGEMCLVFLTCGGSIYFFK